MDDTIHETLVALACRKNPNCNGRGWWKSVISDGPHYSVKILVCLICGAQMDPYQSVLDEHAILHLKDYNLLPFI
jgi:hypothetical protein